MPHISDSVLTTICVPVRLSIIWQEYCEENPEDSVEKAEARTAEKDYIDYKRMTERLMSLGFEFLSAVMNESSEYHKVLVLEEAMEHGEFRAPQNFLSDTLEVFFSSHDRRTIRDPEYRDIMLGSQYMGTKRPNAAWPWTIQQWNPARGQVEFVSCRGRRDCLRSWGYVMWDRSRLEALRIMDCEIHNMQPHGPKAFQKPLLSDRPKSN